MLSVGSAVLTGREPASAAVRRSPARLAMPRAPILAGPRNMVALLVVTSVTLGSIRNPTSSPMHAREECTAALGSLCAAHPSRATAARARIRAP